METLTFLIPIVLNTKSVLSLQRSCDITSPFQATPHCYLACETELVLEDLCARGFVMADRKAGLDAMHCRAAMHELALLHALSLAMKLCHPQEFATRVAACVQEAVFVPENEDWYRGYYCAATRNALTMVSLHYVTNTSSVFITVIRELMHC
jgi:hypothetical protein